MASHLPGPSTEPAERLTCETPPPVLEFDMRTHNNDPDQLVQCPYDKSHHIRVARFPYHLTKCSKSHPDLVRRLGVCPHNARHLVPKHRLAHHAETCEDRVQVSPCDPAGDAKWQVPVSTWKASTTTEDWDAEEEENPVPFVWGRDNNLGSRLCDSAPSILAVGVRVPHSLPWGSRRL